MRHIVLIGNSEFPSDVENLPQLDCPKRDVDKMAFLMADENCGAFESVTAVVDQNHTDIKKAIFKTLNKAEPNDMVMIYYSGHGVKDREGNAYICGRDTVRSEVEVTGISARQIQSFVEKSRCNKIALLFDCCYSGKFGENLGKAKGAEQLFDVSELDDLDAQAKGLVFISSCNSTQTSHEDEVAGHGVFTKYVIRGVESGEADLDGNGYITFDELYQYINREMANDNIRQTPTLVRGNQQNLLHIALNGTKIKQQDAQAMDAYIQDLFGKNLISLSVRNDCIKEIINFQQGEEWREDKIELLRGISRADIDLGTFAIEWQKLSRTDFRHRTGPVGNGQVAFENGVAPNRMGAYRRADVQEYEGNYLVVRPYYGDPGRIRCYVIEVRWNDQIPGLGWREGQGKTDFINNGAIYMPKRASHLSFLAINSGSVRHILVEEWNMKNAMYGVISTLWNDQGAHLKPTSVPILLHKRDPIDPELLGDLSEENPKHADLLRLFESCCPRVFGET